jgi:hypothetical protein
MVHFIDRYPLGFGAGVSVDYEKGNATAHNGGRGHVSLASHFLFCFL